MILFSSFLGWIVGATITMTGYAFYNESKEINDDKYVNYLNTSYRDVLEKRNKALYDAGLPGFNVDQEIKNTAEKPETHEKTFRELMEARNYSLQNNGYPGFNVDKACEGMRA
jgi:hypothetical protein